ncbi:hypothetical protein HPB50_004588 [Hyalomma asiaticum]|uniref:Uncharacterized protein n=1 Tax=Hyalomma asiaticum TaxID=266040 RepID=A0ACB7TF03_HYAAI|nr:hypothetical protein HPB50_004588 [Hyalomma asiaticum]
MFWQSGGSTVTRKKRARTNTWAASLPGTDTNSSLRRILVRTLGASGEHPTLPEIPDGRFAIANYEIGFRSNASERYRKFFSRFCVTASNGGGRYEGTSTVDHQADRLSQLAT